MTFNLKRDLLQGIGSSGVSVLLTIVTTPIMTRIFPAEAYGVNALLMSYTTLVASFGLLGLPLALAREQYGAEQARLLDASSQIAVIIFGFSVLSISLLLLSQLTLPDGMTTLVVLMVPFLVLLNCVQRILNSLLNAKGRFQVQAGARIGSAITTRGLPLALGWLVHPVAASMLAGDGAGKITHAAMTIHHGRLGQDLKALSWWPDVKFLFSTVSDYRNFALQSNFASALPLLAVLGLQVMIGVRLGKEEIGYYVLAQSMITLPVNVFALATAPVVFHRLVCAMDDTPERLPKLALMAMLGYLALGAICMFPVIFFGPAIFAFAFGEPWHSAGMAAAILAIPQVFTFAVTGLLSIFRVTQRMNTWLGFEAAGTTLILTGMLLTPQQIDLMTMMIFLASLKLGYNILLLTGCMWASRQTTN